MTNKYIHDVHRDVKVLNPNYRPWKSGTRPWQKVDANGRAARKWVSVDINNSEIMSINVSELEPRILAYYMQQNDIIPMEDNSRDLHVHGTVTGRIAHRPDAVVGGHNVEIKTSCVSEQVVFDADLRLQELAAKNKIPIAKDRQNAFLYNLMDP